MNSAENFEENRLTLKFGIAMGVSFTLEIQYYTSFTDFYLVLLHKILVLPPEKARTQCYQ